jgi:hypothetical protein
MTLSNKKQRKKRVPLERKYIAIDQESYDLLLKVQELVREGKGDAKLRLLSIAFDRAILKFYQEFDGDLSGVEIIKPVKRQTLYLSPKANAILNGLSFASNKNIKDLSCFIIKRACS